MDLGIPTKGEIQSDSSTAKAFVGSVGSRTPERNTLIHDSFQVQERVQDGDLSIKNVFTAKNCADVGTKPVSAFSTTTAVHNFAGLVFQVTMDSTLHYKMIGYLLK